MPPQASQKPENASDAFVIVQQLTSQLHDTHAKEVVDAVNDLDLEDSQLMVDLLGMVLEKKHHLLKNPDYALQLLTKIASSATVFAHNRILSSKHLTSGNESSKDVYIIQGDPVVCLKVVKRGKKNISEHYSESLVKWAHLNHSNVLPLYGALFDGDDGPVSLISPCTTTTTNIVDHAKTLPQAFRMLLILDALDGLCYLHRLDVIHGGLNPENILISDSGHALITGLQAKTSETSSARYLPPESMEEEDAQPTKAGDIWSFACICYEVLSGNVPFCQFTQERKVVTAVAKGKKPTRPGQEGVGGEEIVDNIWRPVSECWEIEHKDRPRATEVLKALSDIESTSDDRPVVIPLVAPELLQTSTTPGHLERARSLVSRVFGIDTAEQSMPRPSRIPEHLREPLSGLVGDFEKAEAAAVAVKKLSPDDTQALVDALDLVVEESVATINVLIPVVQLLQKIAVSSHVFPQFYKLNRIRYDPSSIAEGGFGKVHKVRDFNLCVSVLTDSSYVSRILAYLTLWARSSHPNIVPFYGVFHDDANEIPRFCLVTPPFKNGVLHDYVANLPQDSRIPLISDVVNGLEFLHRLSFVHNNIRPDNVVVSDEGRGLITSFSAMEMITATTNASMVRSTASYMLRYYSPERSRPGVTVAASADDIWSLGCLCYEVLSRKVPYHQYESAPEIRSALSRAEPLKRPSTTDDDTDQIKDDFWDLVMRCCAPAPGDRPNAAEIKETLTNMEIKDDRPDAQSLPDIDIVSSRSHPEIVWARVEELLSQIQVELLRTPLSKVIQNHTKDTAAAAAKLQHDDIQTIVDYLDVTLKDHLTIPEERNRVLALLSRTMTLTQVFPRRLELKTIKYDPRPIAEGGFGKVHRGLSDPNICVKVTTRVNDISVLIDYIKELILWAHASHPNVLPFYGVFFDESKQICLVSPYMTKGNLREYASQLPQKARIPFLVDTIKGLDYLHGLGVVHTDLKGENVLISDEGRALITDFGASHIITATAKGEATSASVATTLRFTAPEIIQDQTRLMRPTKECDIWSYGCLCYEVLSRKPPYYEYQLDAQVLAALFRGELPKRPGLTNKTSGGNDSDDDWDDLDEKDWDDLDDTIWALILTCLTPKPEDRPSGSRVQELILDVWYSRPAAKGVLGAEVLKQRSDSEVDLNRVGTLLDQLQMLLLAKSIYRHSVQDVVKAVSRLDTYEAEALMNFWAMVLDRSLTVDSELSRLLEIHSTVIASRKWIPGGYLFRTRPRCLFEAVGDGSFGKLYQDSENKVCVKVAKFTQMHPGLQAHWDKSLAPSVHLSHPNILPLYGAFLTGGDYLLSPYIANGNLQSHAPKLPQKSRLLPILDTIDGLMYLHRYGVVHGNLKMQNVLISDEGRGLISDFRPYHANMAAAEDGPTGSFITSTLRFTAPELVKSSWMLPTTESDVWSVGCLIYEVLSRRVPYYEHTEDSQIRSALSQGELPTRPSSADDHTDLIDDESWELIKRCCASEPKNRLKLVDIQNQLKDMGLEDTRPAAKPLPGTEILELRQRFSFLGIHRCGEILEKLILNLPG